MRTIFKYNSEEYTYVVIDGEVVTFKIDKSPYTDEIVLDEEIQIWRGE